MKQRTQHKQKYFGRWWNYTNMLDSRGVASHGQGISSDKHQSKQRRGISMQYKNKTQPKVRPFLFLSKA